MEPSGQGDDPEDIAWAFQHPHLSAAGFTRRDSARFGDIGFPISAAYEIASDPRLRMSGDSIFDWLHALTVIHADNPLTDDPTWRPPPANQPPLFPGFETDGISSRATGILIWSAVATPTEAIEWSSHRFVADQLHRLDFTNPATPRMTPTEADHIWTAAGITAEHRFHWSLQDLPFEIIAQAHAAAMATIPADYPPEDRDYAVHFWANGTFRQHQMNEPWDRATMTDYVIEDLTADGVDPFTPNPT